MEITTHSGAIPLQTTVDEDELKTSDPCDKTIILGSYYPHATDDFQSRVVRVFKDCDPSHKVEPYGTELCQFYTPLILDAIMGFRFDYIVRILSSSERMPDPLRQLELLVDTVSKHTSAVDCTKMFFRCGVRPPMHNIEKLAAKGALKERITYAKTDLCIRPMPLGGSVLLLDDVFYTGASNRVYAYALKKYCGVSRVVAVNLAAARSEDGKDGLGKLTLDTSTIEESVDLRPVWVDKKDVYHFDKCCAESTTDIFVDLRFFAERYARECDACESAHHEKPTKWWNRKVC